MSKNIKTEFNLSAFLCDNCRLVLSKTLIHEDPYLALVITKSLSKDNVYCERCGYADKEHPGFKQTEKDIQYMMGIEELESRNSPSSQSTIFDLRNI